MKQLFFSFFLIVISCISSVANNCDCASSNYKIKQIQDDIDKKLFESIPQRINQLPIIELSCKQQALLCYLQYYISKENLIAADSISNLLKTSFTSNLCDNIQALYNYQVGTLFIKKNIPDSALNYLLKAKELAIKIKNDVLHAKSLSRMAYLFESLLDQPQKSLEYNRQAIRLIQNKDENNLLLLLMGNRSAYFGRIYDLKNDKSYIDSVYLNALQTLELAKKLNITRSISTCYSMISGTFFTKKELSKAIQYCDSGISILNTNVDFRILKALYTKKTDYYIELKDYKKARQFADSMLKYAQLENNILNIASTYERLYELERNVGNYEKALIYYEKHTKINDSIKSIEKTEITTELEQKYNKSENEKRISELNKKNEIDALRVKVLIAGVIAALFAILIIIFFYRQSILKNKFKALEVEQRLNRARMNPHFIFNALSSIQSLSLDPENQPKVSGYLSRFSKIMRQSLESTYNDLVSIEEEISFLENYLNIQKMRFPNKFDYHIETDEDVDIDEIKVPSMLLQPFIENSIEHGFKGIDYRGSILIKIVRENTLLKISITDNGKGFSIDKSEKKYPSRAVQIITDRLAILNKQHKSAASFHVVDDEQIGVKIEVCLPIIF